MSLGVLTWRWQRSLPSGDFAMLLRFWDGILCRRCCRGICGGRGEGVLSLGSCVRRVPAMRACQQAVGR